MRGRKSQRVKVITSKDLELIKQIARTGLCSREQAETYSGLSQDRLAKLCKSNFLKEEQSLYHRELITIYRLADTGIKYVKNSCDSINNVYKYASTMHDIALTKYYYTIEPQYRDRWTTEEDLKHEQEYSLYSGSCLDGLYRDEHGRTHAVEVLTKNYSVEEIKSKEEFASCLGGEVSYLYA